MFIPTYLLAVYFRSILSESFVSLLMLYTNYSTAPGCFCVQTSLIRSNQANGNLFLYIYCDDVFLLGVVKVKLTRPLT